MHNNTKFNQIKADFAFALLNHLRHPKLRIAKIEAAYVCHLIGATKEHGHISWQDIQRAIWLSGALGDTANLLHAAGRDHVGAFSAEQVAELQRLHELYSLALKRKTRAVMSQIADLI
jgi:hypothetical protein